MLSSAVSIILLDDSPKTNQHIYSRYPCIESAVDGTSHSVSVEDLDNIVIIIQIGV